MSDEHKPWCCDGFAAFCPLCPRPTELVRCLGHAYSDRNRETVRISRLHASFAHPDFEYRTTQGPRKQWDRSDEPPTDENGDPDPSWERNADAGRDGWERFDYTEESYWRRPKQKNAETVSPCPRPECGGDTHTDGWGNPTQCPRDSSGLVIDGTTAELHLAPPTPPSIQIMSEDQHTPLVTIHPNGTLEYGPGYTPDEAAQRFWDALRRLAPARCPNCGHTASEAP